MKAVQTSLVVDVGGRHVTGGVVVVADGRLATCIFVAGAECHQGSGVVKNVKTSAVVEVVVTT